VTRYIELALRLARWDSELVDSYYGPREIADAVAAEEPLAPHELVSDADELLHEAMPDRWLTAQVRALRTVASRLAGDEVPYLSAVEAIYGVRPRWFDETGFERAHALLDDVLPGPGAVGVRYRRCLGEMRVPPALIEPAARALADELRMRAQRLIGLPRGESVEIEGVTGVPWRGYARYLGGLRTHVALNVGRPLAAVDLAHITAHESYVGHHTHRAWQEEALVRGNGEIERTLDVLQAPEALISEGIAEVGAALTAGEDGHELTASCLRRLGFDYDADTGARIAAARDMLKPVNSNAALLLHTRAAGTDATSDYLRTWSLLSEEENATTVEKLATPHPFGYVHLYAHGTELCASFVGGDPRRLRELMTARVVPADLPWPRPIASTAT
jgi:hypothetical protein